MNRINIDKNLFSLPADLSNGLITGLKRLQKYNFVFESSGFEDVADDTLKNILKLEGLEIIKSKTSEKSKCFVVNVIDDKIEIAALGEAKNFYEAVELILKNVRSATVKRKTKETDIEVYVSLDGNGEPIINTGIGFFDHMLEQIARHANIELRVRVAGDLHVDKHHTVEDVGIALGEAILTALGNKNEIKRYGYFLPMDDATAKCAVDIGGRAFLNFKCKFKREKVGGFATELTEEFFKSIAAGLKANIFIRSKAKNDHHKIEAMFKAFAKSLNEACRTDYRNAGRLPSTKGVL